MRGGFFLAKWIDMVCRSLNSEVARPRAQGCAWSYLKLGLRQRCVFIERWMKCPILVLEDWTYWSRPIVPIKGFPRVLLPLNAPVTSVSLCGTIAAH